MTLLALLACAGAPPDPAESLVGERLFLEPRFAQLFAVTAGDLNQPAAADPALDVAPRADGDVPGPFAGSTMSCRACHLVDDVTANVDGVVRTYADFAARSPIPDRGDGLTTTVRNSPSLVDASLARDGAFLLHFDGEFTTGADLVRGTFTGRNLGWLPTEQEDAIAHLASVIREDDGSFPLYATGATIPYRDLFAGTDPGIPPGLRLPAELRLDVDSASDAEVLDGVAALVSAYLEHIRFERGLESDTYSGSPYDVFLAKNGLPPAPDPGETEAAYAERLVAELDALATPAWVTDVDRRFSLHRRPFEFGAAELAGLRIFLRLSADPAGASLEERSTGGVGSCVACHAPPTFTDHALHNTGVSQAEYDGVWGEGAFAALAVPDSAAREQDPSSWLPPSAAHPDWVGLARAVPDGTRPGAVDLGAWAIFAHPDHPEAQPGLRSLVDAAYALPPETTDAERLPRAIALFKTPSLRDLAQSAPYFHDGGAEDLNAALAHYLVASEAQRADTLRNGDPRLARIALVAADLAYLRAFLDALTEDYG